MRSWLHSHLIFGLLQNIGQFFIKYPPSDLLSRFKIIFPSLHFECMFNRAQWDLSWKVNLKLEELAHMFFNVKLNFKVGFFWIFFDLSTPWGRKMHICKCMGISMGKWPKKIKWPKITFPGSKMVPKVLHISKCSEGRKIESTILSVLMLANLKSGRHSNATEKEYCRFLPSASFWGESCLCNDNPTSNTTY